MYDYDIEKPNIVENSEHKKKRRPLLRYLRGALIVLALVFSALLVFLIVEYRTFRRERAFSAREAGFSAFLRNHGPLAPADAGLVRPWMTFDYINKIFNLPPDYLKTRLDITDPRYPKLSVSEYAKSHAFMITEYLGDVIRVIGEYPAAQK